MQHTLIVNEGGSEEESCSATSTSSDGESPWPQRFVYLVWAACGVAEGYAAAKVCMIFPLILADQLIFKTQVILKVFISGVGFSMLCQGIMAHFFPERFALSRIYGRKHVGIGRAMFGDFILGIGMAMCGSGPTIFFASMGGGVQTAWGLVVGGLVGALAVALADQFTGIEVTAKKKDGAIRLEEKLGSNSYSRTVLVIGFLFVLAVVALEVFIPFKADLAKYGGPLAQPYPDSIFEWPAWPPIVFGLVQGPGQVLFRLTAGNGMGGTTSFSVAVASMTCNKLNTGLSVFHNPAQHFWQIVYNWVFVFLGAGLSLWTNAVWAMNDTNAPLTAGFSVWQMIVGSAICIVGGRVAGGCTCGHGITGMSELSGESWLAACSIFGGGIVARCVMVYALNMP